MSEPTSLGQQTVSATQLAKIAVAVCSAISMHCHTQALAQESDSIGHTSVESAQQLTSKSAFILWGTVTKFHSYNLSFSALRGRAWTIKKADVLSTLHAKRKLSTSEQELEPTVIGLALSDWSATQLMAHPAVFQEMTNDPAQVLSTQVIAATSSSQSELRLRYCLLENSISVEETKTEMRNQKSAAKELEEGSARLAVLWRNFDRSAASGKLKAKAFECGSPPEGGLPTLFVSRSDLLAETEALRLEMNRQLLAKEVASHLGRWEAAKRDLPAEAKKLVKWYKDQGLKVTIEEATQELIQRQPPTFDEQFKLFTPDPTHAKAPVVKTLDEILEFMVETGAIKPEEKPDTSLMIDASVLQTIANDPELLAIAKGEVPIPN
jgi:hypothetical protein